MPYRKPPKRIKKKKNQPEQPTFVRVRLPRGNQFLGIVKQRLGSSRMSIACLDGKTRICRIPGRLKRSLWVRENNIVMIEPWELDDSKGDVVYKYNPTQVEWLKKQGHLKKLSDFDEF